LRTYLRSDSHLFCGHWNGSPVEIGFLPTPLRQVPDSEVLHYHDYYEYYVMLEGSAELEVEGQSVPLRADIVMVEPGERHCIRFVDPERRTIACYNSPALALNPPMPRPAAGTSRARGIRNYLVSPLINCFAMT
jgi:mannose-6-phosphate isomerase-like protein (cupin superfamily)